MPNARSNNNDEFKALFSCIFLTVMAIWFVIQEMTKESPEKEFEKSFEKNGCTIRYIQDQYDVHWNNDVPKACRANTQRGYSCEVSKIASIADEKHTYWWSIVGCPKSDKALALMNNKSDELLFPNATCEVDWSLAFSYNMRDMVMRRKVKLNPTCSIARGNNFAYQYCCFEDVSHVPVGVATRTNLPRLTHTPPSNSIVNQTSIFVVV